MTVAITIQIRFRKESAASTYFKIMTGHIRIRFLQIYIFFEYFQNLWRFYAAIGKNLSYRYFLYILVFSSIASLIFLLNSPFVIVIGNGSTSMYSLILWSFL